MTIELKNSLGMDTTNEVMFIMHIAADDDGSLKVKKVEDFRDSKVYLEIREAITAAIAAAQANK